VSRVVRIVSRAGAPAAAALIVAAVIVAALAFAGEGRARVEARRATTSAAAGSPDRGRAVYLSRGCAGCHAQNSPPNPPVGPLLTPDLLRSDAASAGKPLGPFVVESLLLPNAFVSPGYVSNVMPPTGGLAKQQLDDLVSFLIGSPYTSPAAGGITLPAHPVAACKASKACRAIVAGWARTQRLPARVLDGARIVALVGCLSCHTDAGAGTRSGSAPDLTRVGATGLTVAALLRRLSCPGCVTSGSVMPSFARLGSASLRQVALFLSASRGGKT